MARLSSQVEAADAFNQAKGLLSTKDTEPEFKKELVIFVKTNTFSGFANNLKTMKYHPISVK